MTGRGFFLNSLVLSALFGASFCLILMFSSDAHTVLDGTPYTPMKLSVYTMIFGAVCGMFLLVISGLTCLNLAFFYATLFVVGPELSSRSLKEALPSLVLGVLLTVLAVLAVSTVLKRCRDIVREPVKARALAAAVITLSCIPLLGTLFFWVLALMPPDADFLRCKARPGGKA